MTSPSDFYSKIAKATVSFCFELRPLAGRKAAFGRDATSVALVTRLCIIMVALSLSAQVHTEVTCMGT